MMNFQHRIWSVIEVTILAGSPSSTSRATKSIGLSSCALPETNNCAALWAAEKDTSLMPSSISEPSELAISSAVSFTVRFLNYTIIVVQSNGVEPLLPSTQAFRISPLTYLLISCYIQIKCALSFSHTHELQSRSSRRESNHVSVCY